MKYVAIDGPMHEEIYVFMNSMPHDVFVDLLGVKRDAVLGAGFVDIISERFMDAGSIQMVCHGKSTSLGVVSRGEKDTRLLQRGFAK